MTYSTCIARLRALVDVELAQARMEDVMNRNKPKCHHLSRSHSLHGLLPHHVKEAV